MQATDCALLLPRLRAGRSMLHRIPITAITTSNSINVNAAAHRNPRGFSGLTCLFNFVQGPQQLRDHGGSASAIAHIL